MDISSMIDYFKFGYHGDTIDLLYFFIFFRFAIFPFLKWLYNKLKEVIL